MFLGDNMISNGIDIVDINRFSKLLQKETFMNRYFTISEKEYIKKANNNLSTIAGIYASKEAFLKAIKKDFNVYSFYDIEILHQDKIPYFNISPTIKKENNIKDISLSISHDGNYAIASVIILF